MQWNPVLGRVSREVILGQIGPVVGRETIGIEDRDRPGVTLPAQHLGSGVPRCPRSYDRDRNGMTTLG